MRVLNIINVVPRRRVIKKPGFAVPWLPLTLYDLFAEFGEFGGEFGSEAIPAEFGFFPDCLDFPCDMFGDGERDFPPIIPIGILWRCFAVPSPNRMIKVVTVGIAATDPINRLPFAEGQGQVIHFSTS